MWSGVLWWARVWVRQAGSRARSGGVSGCAQPSLVPASSGGRGLAGSTAQACPDRWPRCAACSPRPASPQVRKGQLGAGAAAGQAAQAADARGARRHQRREGGAAAGDQRRQPAGHGECGDGPGEGRGVRACQVAPAGRSRGARLSALAPAPHATWARAGRESLLACGQAQRPLRLCFFFFQSTPCPLFFILPHILLLAAPLLLEPRSPLPPILHAPLHLLLPVFAPPCDSPCVRGAAYTLRLGRPRSGQAGCKQACRVLTGRRPRDDKCRRGGEQMARFV